jgi:hypothetical protein
MAIDFQMEVEDIFGHKRMVFGECHHDVMFIIVLEKGIIYHVEQWKKDHQVVHEVLHQERQIEIKYCTIKTHSFPKTISR